MPPPKILEFLTKDGNYDKGRICALLTGLAIFLTMIWLIVLTTNLHDIKGSSPMFIDVKLKRPISSLNLISIVMAM